MECLLQVVNEDGKRVDPGETGELCLKKPCRLLVGTTKKSDR